MNIMPIMTPMYIPYGGCAPLPPLAEALLCIWTAILIILGIGFVIALYKDNDTCETFFFYSLIIYLLASVSVAALALMISGMSYFLS